MKEKSGFPNSRKYVKGVSSMDIIKNAIYKAVEENEQNPSLGKAINAWFNELASGNETIADEENVRNRIDIILKQTKESN
jgi:hypothetical protein